MIAGLTLGFSAVLLAIVASRLIAAEQSRPDLADYEAYGDWPAIPTVNSVRFSAADVTVPAAEVVGNQIQKFKQNELLTSTSNPRIRSGQEGV